MEVKERKMRLGVWGFVHQLLLMAVRNVGVEVSSSKEEMQ